MDFYGMFLWAAANPLAYLGAGLAVVAVVGIVIERSRATAALPKVVMPAPVSAPKKSPEPESMPAHLAEPSAKTLSAPFVQQPHEVLLDALPVASHAIQTAKDVSTPDAPEHVKAAAAVLSAAAVDTLNKAKAVAETHEEKHDDGKTRLTADEWVKTLNDTAGAARRSMGHDEGEKHGD